MAVPTLPSWLRWLLWPLGLVVLLALISAAVAALAIQPQAQLPAPTPSSGAQLAVQARQLWAQLRPGAAPAGALRTLPLAERDLNALLAQAAPARGQRWRAQVRLSAGRLRLVASQPSPVGGGWLNLDLVWALDAPFRGAPPPLLEARVGRLPLPPAWVEWAARRYLAHQQWLDTAEALGSMVEGIQAQPGQLWLQWRWQPERAGRALAVLLSPSDKAALLAQHHRLLELLGPYPAGSGVALAPLLQALGHTAIQRLPASDADTELRALLAVLALQAVGRDLGAWLPEARAAGSAPAVALSLREREDMAQHFLLSALLAWQGGQGMAASLGLAKELADSRGGSGFSFNDLAADEAGSWFGRLCASNAQSVLARLAAGIPDSAFFPEVADLPEYLSAQALYRRYGPPGSPGYEAQMQQIRRRVAALPLFQGLPAP